MIKSIITSLAIILLNVLLNLSPAKAGVVFAEDFEGANPLANFTLVGGAGDTAVVATAGGSNVVEIDANGSQSFAFLATNTSVSSANDFSVSFDFEILDDPGSFDDASFFFGELGPNVNSGNNFRVVLNNSLNSSDVTFSQAGAISTVVTDFVDLSVNTLLTGTLDFTAATNSVNFSVEPQGGGAPIGSFSITGNADLANITDFQFGFGSFNDIAQFDNIVITVVPEPSTYVLLGAGLVAMALLYRKKRTCRR